MKCYKIKKSKQTGNKVVFNLVQVIHLKRLSKIESRNGTGEHCRGKQQRSDIVGTLLRRHENTWEL